MAVKASTTIYYGIIIVLVLVVAGLLWRNSTSSTLTNCIHTNHTPTQTGGAGCSSSTPALQPHSPNSPNSPAYLNLAGALGPEKPCPSGDCDLLKTLNDERKYAQGMIDQYRSENFKLNYYINKLVKQVDQGSTDVAYRKRLSNEYYPVQPYLAYFPKHNPLNLREDDFSNKTFSESKFLAPTQPSDYYGDDVHIGSYLCDDQYPYTDRQTLGNYQIEVTPQIKQY